MNVFEKDQFVEAVTAMQKERRYKWIARTIDTLEPKTDYARIWALSVTYYVNNFMMNVIYTTGLQCFSQPPAANALMVCVTKKLLDRKQQRYRDTMVHFWHWFEFGVDEKESLISISKVNEIHRHLARQYPGTFPSRDIVYTAAWIGVAFHRLQLLIGQAGFSTKQKIAAHLYWSNLSSYLWSEEGYIDVFPESFDEMLALVEAYERLPWGQTENGRVLAKALTDQFVEARMPALLRGLGRQLILSAQGENVRHLMQMGAPHPVFQRLIFLTLKSYFFLRKRILPDPRFSTPHKNRLRAELEAKRWR